jgi:putative tryptophan/tyrosine transport system substrate-binding protein
LFLRGLHHNGTHEAPRIHQTARRRGSRACARVPFAAHAQQTTLPVVGFLASASEAGYAGTVAAVRTGLNDAGFVEKQNLLSSIDGRISRRGDRVRRREFIVLLGGVAVAWPLVGRAQQPERMRRIGLLDGGSEDDSIYHARVQAFVQSLQEIGWTEGRNIRIERRLGVNISAGLAQTVAKEMVTLQPDVILAQGTPTLLALSRETRSIPIVFVNVSDPVGDGFVASLARPGGNITGFSQYEYTIGGKWLELLNGTAPSVGRVAFIMNAANPASRNHLRAIESAAASLALRVTPMAVGNTSEFERAIEPFAAKADGGLIVLPGATTVIDRGRLIALAAHYHLPAIYAEQVFPPSGGLMSYGIDATEQHRRAASCVDRILKGEKPADLPVQQPTKYFLIVNLKTAKALGLTVPTMLLAGADEVIE